MNTVKVDPTPGPWTVAGDGSAWTLVRAGDPKHGQRIASTFVSHATQSNPETRLARIRENEANARLIAAAPDMLAALLSTRDSLQAMADEGIVAQDSWPSLNAVIAKVKGDA